MIDYDYHDDWWWFNDQKTTKDMIEMTVGECGNRI